MKKILYGITILMATTSVAQQFQQPTTIFSRKINAYVTLKDGTNLIGVITDVDKKAGIMKSFRLKDAETGKKRTIKPEDDIAYMYAPSYRLDKDKPTKIDYSQVWNQTELDKELLDQGLSYFETTVIKTKNKTKPHFGQVMNPGFSKKVKVYYDPWNGASTALGDGIAKSYYVKKESDPAAYEFNKKKYMEGFSSFWNCEKVGTDATWTGLVKHVVAFTTDCE